MKRILLFGANGQVGQALQAETLPDDITLTAYGRAECDLTDHAETQKVLHDLKPDIIINAAAMTNVDACEKDRKGAEAANFEAPANLAAQCAARDIPLIHLSTDFVFDGRDQSVPYPEDAQMNPLSVYADTKMMGEIAVQQGLAWHVIVRVSSVFSAFGQNILTRALGNLATKEELRIVNDQTACPTYAPDLAKALLTIASDVMRGKHGAFGIFHYCGAEASNRLQFVEEALKHYAAFTDKRPRLLPAASSDFPGFAERPAYSALNCAKIKRVYGIEQTSWRSGVHNAITTLHQQGKLPQ